MAHELQDISLTRREAVQHSTSLGIQAMTKTNPLMTGLRLLGDITTNVQLQADQPAATHPSAESEVFASKLGIVVDLIAETCKDLQYEFSPGEDRWDERSAQQVQPLGSGFVGISHSLYENNKGGSFEVARVAFYPTDDTSKNAEIFFRKTGVGVGRKNHGYELGDDDFGIEMSGGFDAIDFKAIRRSNAYHEALQNSQFRQFDIDVCIQAIREAFGPNALQSTYFEDAVEPMINLEALQAFNDFWLANYSSTDFESNYSIDENGIVGIDSVGYNIDDKQIDLLGELRKFPDVLKVGTTLVNIGSFFREITRSDLTALPQGESGQFMIGDGLEEQIQLEKDPSDDIPMLKAGDALDLGEIFSPENTTE